MHPCLFLILGESFQSFITEYNICCGFFTCSFYHVVVVSFYSLFVECFFHERVLNFLGCFFCIRWHDYVLFVHSSNMVYITLIDFSGMLNHSYSPEINPTWYSVSSFHDAVEFGLQVFCCWRFFNINVRQDIELRFCNVFVSLVIKAMQAS